jgi:hypothetical protein
VGKCVTKAIRKAGGLLCNHALRLVASSEACANTHRRPYFHSKPIFSFQTKPILFKRAFRSADVLPTLALRGYPPSKSVISFAMEDRYHRYVAFDVGLGPGTLRAARSSARSASLS